MKITTLIAIISLSVLVTSCADKCGKDVEPVQKAANGCYSKKN